MSRIRVMHYLNQFFAGIGAEEKADVPPGSHEGALGPGKRLQALLGDSADIVVTAFCGDNYFAEHTNEALTSIVQIAREQNVEMVVAGPAFQAGRYGFACVEVCHSLSTTLGLYGVAGMNIENPGIAGYEQYKDRRLFILPTAEEVRGMEDALSRMAKFVSKLATGLAIGPAAEEGYIPRGIRIIEVASKSGKERAIDMLLDKLAGRSFTTEIPIEMPEAIPVPRRIANLKEAQLALASTTGVHAAGNPYGFVVVQNTKWAKYPINKLNSMKDGKWEVVHAGYAAAAMNENPNYGVPLDVCRQMEREGVFARLNPSLYATTGNGGTFAAMQAIGKEMGLDMKAEGVDGVLLVSC